MNYLHTYIDQIGIGYHTTKLILLDNFIQIFIGIGNTTWLAIIFVNVRIYLKYLILGLNGNPTYYWRNDTNFMKCLISKSIHLHLKLFC